MNDDCIFCGVIAGTIPAKVAHRSDALIAIEDIHPQAPTHLLLIPRQHVARVVELDESHADLLVEIFTTATRLARERGLDRGFRVVVNDGPHGGQTVDHLHFHLLGGRPMQWPPG